MIDTKPPARPAKAADDLIIDEQHIVLVANITDNGVVLRNGHHAGSAGATYRLDKEGGNVLRTDLIDNLLECPGAFNVAARIGELVSAVVA